MKNKGNLTERFSGFSAVTKIFDAPVSSRFLSKAKALEAEISFAYNKPVFESFPASSVAFPPGAAHKSRTLSPFSIGSLFAGSIADGSCK